MSFADDNGLIKFISYSGLVIGGLTILVGGLLFVFQDKMLYFPSPPGFPKTPDANPPGCISPSEWTIDGDYCDNVSSCEPIPFEESFVQTKDGHMLHTWLMIRDENAPTLLYFHGNAGNMGFRLQNAAGMYGKTGLNVLMMDYRGYGRSTGVPNEAGIKIDAASVLLYAKNHPRLAKSPMIAFGRSLGGAVAFWLANEFPRDIAAVIVENTFTSVPDMVDIIMPWAKSIKSFVLRISWDSLSVISRLQQPVLFISGDQDELVPPSHMKSLHNRAEQSSHKELYVVAGGTHNDTWIKAGLKYYFKLKAFTEKALNIQLLQTSDANGKSTSTFNNEKASEMHHRSHLPTMTTSFSVK